MNESRRRLRHERSINQDFDAVLKACGYVHDSSYNLSDKPEVACKLGKAFFDYMIASIYDTSWEGYPTRELVGVEALMRDFKTAVEHGLLS
jgi:hypothetical protein